VRRALLLGFVAALLAAGPASAAIFVHLTETSVHRGGRLHLFGNAAAMPLYVLPVAQMPLCMRYDTCASLMRRSAPPRSPFVFAGRTPGTSPGFGPTRLVVVRLPKRIRPGRYKLFVWCVQCGGTLIPASAGVSSQTLHIVS
jgi:hypothetical protein